MRRRDATEACQREGGAGHRPSRRRAPIALAALAALALLSLQTADARGKIAIGPPSALASTATTVGFWAGEAVPGTDWSSPDTYWNRRSTRVYTPQLWNVLRRNRVPLYFNLRYRRDFGAVPPGEPHRHDGLAILRKANRLGIPVWGWVLIPYADGYWAWEGAAGEQFAAVRALVHWMRTKRVRLQGLVLDPESPLRTPFETAAAVLGGGGAASSSLLHPAIDPASQCAAWRGYSHISRWANRHHVNLAAAPAPAALDDLDDGRLALQDAAQFIVPDAPWHALFFQAYRSVFAYFSGHDPGPGIVSSYFHSAQREYGSVGQISLGSAGRRGYKRLASLVHDVRLAATLGAREVPIYSLERTLRAYGGPRAVTQLVRAAGRPFTGSTAAEAAAPTTEAGAQRAAIRHTDRALAGATPTLTAENPPSASANRWPNGCNG
ncbi:MAG: hypothetical protein ACRDLL_06420 [Solirubrobacterales bacterium]